MTAAAASSVVPGRFPSSDRAEELLEKFRLILASPLAEGVARIVEESFRLLPIIPPPTSGEPSRYAPPIELKPARHSRGRSPIPSDRTTDNSSETPYSARDVASSAITCCGLAEIPPHQLGQLGSESAPRQDNVATGGSCRSKGFYIHMRAKSDEPRVGTSDLLVSDQGSRSDQFASGQIDQDDRGRYVSIIDWPANRCLPPSSGSQARPLSL